MSNTMKALVRYEGTPGMMEFRDVAVPLPGPDHLVLEVKAVGICGRDLEHFHETLSPSKVPFIPGHEFSGVVVGVSADEKDFAVGDRVTAETVDTVCGTCSACRAGTYNICKKRKNISGGMNGAFTSFVRVPKKYVHKLPDAVSFEEGAMIEPTCVGYNATLVNSDPQKGDLVVVIGAGTIGLLCAQMAKLRGAEVALIGLHEDEYRLAIGRDLGVEHIFYATEDPVQKILELTNGDGAPLVIDTVGGASQTIDQALEMVRPGGQITKVGWFMKSTNTSLDTLVRKAVRLQGSFSHTYDIWEKCIELVATGQINVKKMISKTLPLSQWHDGFDICTRREAVKVILKPDIVSNYGESV